jgi:hypothetical protein
VALPPPQAMELWLDRKRWATWIEGFGTVLEEKGDWPAAGSRLVWQSRPGGRGRVTEMVREYVPAGKHAVELFEDKLTARQSVTFAPHPEGSEMTYIFEYELAESGPLKWLFTRREMQLAADELLRRFQIEAAEDASHGSL